MKTKRQEVLDCGPNANPGKVLKNCGFIFTAIGLDYGNIALFCIGLIDDFTLKIRQWQDFVFSRWPVYT